MNLPDRLCFRIREMAAVLHPHLLGGSLGWHDFLGSTARLFRHDPRYRIPVKADPTSSSTTSANPTASS